MTDDDSKITPFPDERKRRRMLLLRAANDGPKTEPAINLPPVVKTLSLLVIAAFAVQKILPYLAGEERAGAWIYDLAFVPARYGGGMTFGWQAVVSPVTHLFLHGGWLHVCVNILSLMAFGAGLEKWMGGKKLLVIYFCAAFCGLLAQFAWDPAVENPVIGASGAISGLFGALVLEMHARGYMNGGGTGTGGLRKLLPFIAVWIVSSVVFGMYGMPGADSAIAWPVHIGGFVGGMVLCRPVARLNI